MTATIDTAPDTTTTDTILLQRLEGVAAFGLGVVAYFWLGQSWLVFALVFFVPDLTMLGYVRSSRLGALTYNFGHSYVGPAVLAVSGIAFGPMAFGLAAIWVAHIGFDRMLGYGLKFQDSFQHTHLGPIGKARTTARSR